MNSRTLRAQAALLGCLLAGTACQQSRSAGSALGTAGEAPGGFDLALLPATPFADAILNGRAPLDPAVATSAMHGAPLAVASDGTDFLVAWTEYRQGDWDIYGARVSADGTLLDIAGIPISTAPGDQYSPAIAFNGQDYVVVWRDGRYGTSSGIFAARVTLAGQVRDAGGLALYAGSLDCGAPAIAVGPDSALVTWGALGGNNYDLLAARLGSDGALLDATPLKLEAAVGRPPQPSAVFDGQVFLVVYSGVTTNLGAAYMLKVDPASGRSSAPSQATPEAYNTSDFRVATNGTTIVISWASQIQGSQSVMAYRTVLDTNGSILRSDAIDSSVSTVPIAIDSDGAGYLMAWGVPVILGQQGALVRRTLDGDGLVTGGLYANAPPGTSWMWPAIAYAGGQYLEVYLERPSGGADNVMAMRATPAGLNADTQALQLTATPAWNAEKPGSVAFDGTNYLVVWTDNRNGDPDVYGIRVSKAGEPIDAAAFAIARGTGEQSSPEVVFDGTAFTVYWLDGRTGTNMDLYARSVSTAGVPAALDVPISTTAHGSHPGFGVARGDTDTLVVWTDRRNGNVDIYGARVGPGVNVLDGTGFPVASLLTDQVEPRLAFDGTNYLVAWSDARLGGRDIFCSRVSKAGAVLDVAGIQVATGAATRVTPDVAFDGSNHLVVWNERGTAGGAVRLARVSKAGRVIDATPLEVGEAGRPASLPRLAYDGRRALVAWVDPQLGQLRSAQLDPTSGVLLSSADVDLDIDATRPFGLHMAAGEGLLAYGRLEPFLGVFRGSVQAIATWFDVGVAKTGAGAGLVASSPAGLSCGATCAAKFDAGVSVTLTPQPEPGSVFAGWSGDCSGTGACGVDATANRQVTAQFDKLTYRLSVAKSGGGSGSVSAAGGSIACGATCSASYPAGSAVVLSAAPAAGSAFVGWEGACAGTGTCAVSMDGPIDVAARFEPFRTLTVTRLGDGQGRVTGDGGGLDCGTACSVSVVDGTTIHLAAAPGTWASFGGWGGGCSGTGGCTVTMTADVAVSATFVATGHLFQVTKVGAGAGVVVASPGALVCGLDCEETYSHGAMVALAAMPEAGSRFAGWSGACSGSGACTVQVNDASTVTARFEPAAFQVAVARSGEGSGAVASAPGGLSCPGTCSASFEVGTTIVLTATPDAGSTFVGWSGACSGSGACTVTVDAAKGVEAVFAKAVAPPAPKSGGGCSQAGEVPGVLGLLALLGLRRRRGE